jgi:RHS repeat-associated protein
MAPASAMTSRFNDVTQRGRASVVVLMLCLLGMTASAASAETLMMPSRDMLMGGAQVVWGVTTLPNHTTASPTTYTITFGDGSANATGNVTDRSYIAVTHTFASAGPFTATLRVTNAGTTESATVVLRVFDGSVIAAEQVRGVRINSAIEDGLRYLWVNQANRTTTFPSSVTTNWGSSYPESFAALIVLAFQNHGYQLPNSDAAPTGVYEKYIVRRGMNFVIDELRQFSLTAQAAGDPCVNVDDGPAPCVGLRQNQQQEGYATALAILPLAASNALTRHVAEIAGSQNAGYVVGKTYGEVLQRLVNAMAWGQGESGFARGGWAYSFNAGNTDGSTIGWNVLALLDAAAAGITVPAFVKTEFVNFAIPYGLNNDGTFDYTSGNNPAVAQGTAGANMAKNGIGVQALFYADKIGLGDARVLAGRNAISSRWNAPVSGDNYPCASNLYNKGCGYAMFNVFKALKLQGVTTLPGVSRAAGPGTIPAGDWYADYVDWLLANQTTPTTLTGGHWAGLSFSCCGEGVVGSAALAELILSPVALIAPDPTLFSTIGLGPTTALLAPGGAHTVTATATSANGAPVPGATVNFSVLSGPNTGASGQGVTNAGGQTTFTYTDAGGPGRDTIRAFIGTLGSNTVEALWQVPTCTSASATLQTAMYPLDQGWRRVSITGVTGATVTQVCQDEPPNFENIAAWAVDADGVGTSAASVRAQRSGTRTAPGNGRVYHIYYIAASCSGEVTVGVPTVANGTAGDDGARYNSVTGTSCTAPTVPTVALAPSLIGKTPAAAAADAAAAGLLLTVSTLNSPNVPAGTIISQLPSGGTTVARGSAIEITVSSGPTSVIVPDVVGKPQSTAMTQIASVGLAPTFTQANDPVVAAGLVLSQAPLAGTPVPPGSGVNVIVSLGPSVATVPNVVARDLAAAVTAISAAGLNIGTANSVYDATAAGGLIISQTPTGGTTVGLGTAVNIVFSRGPQPVPVPVPSVVGQTEEQALANIAAASLVVGTISRVTDENVRTGYVIAQVPANTGTALPGSSVDLVVSIGPPGSPNPPGGGTGSNPRPTVTIETPTSGTSLNTDIQVIGSVQDDDLTGWTVEYRVPGTSTWNRFGSGTTAVASGVLGTFPATLVANGPYRIRLTAADNSVALSTEIEVQVDSNDLKLGDFTLSYEDMRVQAITFPISVTRTYDTKRLYAGDFGPGWFLSFTGVDLRRAANNDIYITLPTGRRVQFKFSPVKQFLFPIYVNRYIGVGVSDTLETTDCPYLFGGGGVYLCGFFPYDPQDFVLKTAEGLTYTLHANGGISRIEDRAGNFVTIAPNAIATSSGLTVPIVRGAGNRITRIGEPTGTNGINYSYDAAGRLTEVRDQSDQPTTFFYEDARFPNYLTRIVDPLGRPVVRTIFDDAGRLIARCNANADPVTLEGCARFNHDVAARIQTLIDGRGARTDLVLDSRGNVVTERRYLDGGTFQDTNRDFDAENRLLREFGPTGAKLREYTYDSTGNVLTAMGADGRTTTFTHNSVCNQVETQRDPLGQLSRFTYDASCNLVSATGTDGTVTTLTYTPLGQLASLRDATGSTWHWEYDANGFPKTVTDALGKTIQPTFNANGELIAQIDRNGRRIDFAYDASHRLIRETWNTTPARTTTYDYWPDGTVRRAADPNSSLQFTYTSTGDVETVDTSGTPGIPNLLLTYGYDRTGHITSVTDSLGATTSLSYDVLNRLAKIEQAGTGVNSKRVDFSYDAGGLLERIRRFANLSGSAEVAATSYEYECAGCADRLSAIRHRRIADGATIHDITFQRNDFGDIREIGDADGHHVYGYDLARQLASAQHTATGGSALETYVYDAVGNRQSSPLFAYGYSPVGNRLLFDDSYFYRYDDEGNLVAQTSWSSGASTFFTYDYFNRLIEVSQREAAGTETGRSTYVYDVSDRRIESNENGVVRRYAYDGVNPFLKFDASGQIVSRRLYAEGADKILADDTGGGTRWFLTDHLGTVRDLLANDGSVLAHYSYDSYGQPLATGAPAVENDLGFTGREYSPSTGLLYLRARYYSPRLGRFISEDPIGFAGRDINTYRYAQNSPLNLFDLNGETFFENAAIEARIQAFVTAAEECLGKAVFTAIGEAGVYLLLAGEGIPIYPGGDANVYVGKTTRSFAVRFSEHAGKLIGETRSFRVSEEFLAKNPKALRTIEQLLMNAFGGKAQLANKINASRKLFCQ